MQKTEACSSHNHWKATPGSALAGLPTKKPEERNF
jgi:hypothetical protein